MARRMYAAVMVVAALSVAAAACDGGTGLISTNPTGRVQGRVLAGDGTGAPDVVITLAGPEVQTIATGADGTYGFSGLAAGQYTVSATAPTGFVVNQPSSIQVSLASGEIRTGVDFTIAADATDPNVP